MSSQGLAWLFLGVANTDALLYDDEWQESLKKFPDNFRVDYALSREQTNKDGGKMYIQDKVPAPTVSPASRLIPRLPTLVVEYGHMGLLLLAGRRVR